MGAPKKLDEAGMVGVINTTVNSFATKKEFADQAGISQAYLSQMLSGNRGISDHFLTAVGLRRVHSIHYEFIEEIQNAG